MAPALASATSSRLGCCGPFVLSNTNSALVQKHSLFYGLSGVQVSKAFQSGRRLGFYRQVKQASASACSSTFGGGSSFTRRENAEHAKVPRRDVSAAARKSRSMREMEDEEEGFQSLVKQMDSQQRKVRATFRPKNSSLCANDKLDIFM